ncbi:uncharacterized protein LOC135208689 [Macrobrachium nipponense]|uniref:uncharacterized protein LOC135208689 n=1 Tax=Macrobrachium nipponense TaxID=159736 RepID=UPI0030C87E1C
MESPAANSESLQTFRANFECSIRSLESEKLELNELYTILLYTKLPQSVSETVKRRCGDDWLVLDTFKKYLEEEICNLRTFVSTDVNKTEKLSSISTFTVNQSQAVRQKTKGNVNKSSYQQSKRCALCDKEHWWTQCKTYATRDEKLNRIRALQLCFVCASKKHFSVDCDKPSCNNGCKMRHHRILCDKDQTGKQSKNKQSGVQVGTLSVNEQNKPNKSGKQSILPTATIPLKGKTGRMVRLRGLLDTCTERTFIKRSALERLQYRSKGVEKIALRGYLTSKPVHEYKMISVAIPHKYELIIMDCIVVDELPEYAKKFDVKRSLKSLCKTKINLTDKDFDLPVENQSTIELLIGVDNVYNILHPGFKRVRNLILLPTIFGYVVTGTCSASPTRETHVTILKLAVQTEEIEATHNENPKTDLDALWSLDRLGIDCSELREQDQRVLKDFESTITYSEIDKQYVVALPWRTNRFRLKTNFGLAMSRLRQQTIKFQKDVDYLDHYQEILQEQEDRGFIEKVIYNKSDVDCHYLAHHGVLKDSATTPIRIVFDCSSKKGKNGLSLNDCLWTGPHVTADLLRVLLQFRTNTFACIGDIEKAFLMVQLREEDRNYTRFLWLENPTDPNSKLIVYRFRVVLFGATCSSFLLNATIKHHLSTVVLWLPRSNTVDVVERLKTGLYVDNLQFTANSEFELMDLYFNANKIFAQAHLYLKEWVSNSESIQTIAAAYQIEAKQKQIHKVLGLNWDIIKDVLTINPTRINR